MSRRALVYFVAPVGGGPVKIGFSAEPLQRLDMLMSWSPVPLQVLASAPGTQKDEGAIHAAFSEHWSHREWFRGVPEIYALIHEVKTTGEIPERYRWAPGKRATLKIQKRKPWTPEQKAGASKVHRERWDQIRNGPAFLQDVIEFLGRSGMSDQEFDKAVGLVGMAAAARRGNIGWPFCHRERIRKVMQERAAA